MFHVKHLETSVFPKPTIDSFCNGGSVGGLTKSASVLFLESVVKTVKIPVFVSFEAEKISFDLYNKQLEHDGSSLYYPYFQNHDAVPGFNPEEKRYQKEAVIALASGGERVCFGTNKSLKTKNIQKKNNITSISFKVEERVDRDTLIEQLVSFGYLNKPLVSDVCEYSVRGDIVDIYPTSFKNPIRVSFNLGRIEKISLFNPLSQLTIKPLKKLYISDYNENPQVVDYIDITEHTKKHLFLTSFVERGCFSFYNQDHTSINIITTTKIVLSKNKQSDRLSKIASLYKKAVNTFVVSKPGLFDKLPLPKEIKYHAINGSLEFGFFLNLEKTLVLSANDLLSAYYPKSRWQLSNLGGEPPPFGAGLSGLSVGDLIVHVSFGVGRFSGIFEKSHALGLKEGLEIEYSNGRVFVSMDQIYLVHRYVGGGKKPRISTLGSKKWSGEIKKTKKAAVEVASDILKIYSEKPNKRSFFYTKENDLDNILRQSFSFIETPDQKQAIQDVYDDMNGEKPMDRLICGDVGFGKTEVAIRAIFKAFLSDRLSLFLCPTTILADQHYTTCKERLSGLGVTISLLSRFKTLSEQKKVLSKLSNKKVDLLIGTHRVLSEDVFLPKLGLLIIDEEHRFGVQHKEKIRSLKLNIDLLTLTATPIPRTLQQALFDLKSLSTIKTPPVSRRSIVTSVCYFDWDLIFLKIEQELSRRGQVYFVNNDIKTIPIIVNKLKNRFQKHSIAGASGKMRSKDLETIVLSFFSGGVDVLVCTTIIESGLDVSNANCIIINNAQNFGLSQLYQIRGRVGRGSRQANCLLLIPKKQLEKDAFSRLKTVEQNTSLGAGYNISMKDLEIRGAGSLFGYKQSGHISSVGLEMYCDLLKTELNKNKKTSPQNQAPLVTTNILAEINKNYMEDQGMRVDYYYRIAKANDLEALSLIKKELVDAFGPIPNETKTLLNIAKLKIFYLPTPVQKIEISKNNTTLFLKDHGRFQSVDSLFLAMSTFKHKRLINYRYKNESGFNLSIILETKDIFPNLNLLFCFVRLFS